MRPLVVAALLTGLLTLGLGTGCKGESASSEEIAAAAQADKEVPRPAESLLVLKFHHDS